MTDYEKEQVKGQLINYLDRITRTKAGKYICPLCSSGTGEHGTPAFNIIPGKNNQQFKCHSCGAGGDIFDLYQLYNKVDQKTAFKELGEMYLNNNNYKPTTQPQKQPVKEPQTNYTDFFFKAHSVLNKCDYLLKRGISEEIQDLFNIGYVENWKHPKAPNSPTTPRIIIPTSEYSYLARDTRQNIPDKQKQYSKSKVGKTHIFNISDLEKEFCFIVEGEIDALSIIQCGFPCIALGSANMVNKLLAYCKNKRPAGVLIFALDNDTAGKKAMEIIPEFQKVGIRCMTFNVSGTAKDPNDLLVADSEQLKRNLQQAIEEAKNIPIYAPAPADERPLQELPYYFFENDKGKLSINTALLARYIRERSKYIFVRNHATEGVNRFWYKNGCYCHISDEELRGYIKSFVTKYDEMLLKMRDVHEVFNNLTTDLNFISSDKLNADENIINFQNGLLDLETMELKPHSPDVITTIQIPCNYNPTATDSPTFDKFLEDFTEGSQEKKRFLLQYMALCISNIKGYRIKKALFMVGDGNTGKSQLKGLTERLIGLENCSAVTLAELEARFGTSNLYNKRLVGDSDMSFMSVKELKMFKQVTGGDSVPVEFKGRTPFNYIYNGLMWFCMNELPRFSGDRGQWVYDRIVIFKADNVVPEDKRDKHLIDKMFSERETIISKYLIPALSELLKNDININIPAECTALSKQYQQDNNPVHRFYTECCTDRPNNKVSDSCTTKKMYEVFKAWCKDNNNGYVLSVQEFNKELIRILKVNDIKQIQKIVHGTRYYVFTLTLETKQDYQGVYGVDRVQ